MEVKLMPFGHNFKIEKTGCENLFLLPKYTVVGLRLPKWQRSINQVKFK